MILLPSIQMVALVALLIISTGCHLIESAPNRQTGSQVVASAKAFAATQPSAAAAAVAKSVKASVAPPAPAPAPAPPTTATSKFNVQNNIQNINIGNTKKTNINLFNNPTGGPTIVGKNKFGSHEYGGKVKANNSPTSPVDLKNIMGPQYSKFFKPNGKPLTPGEVINVGPNDIASSKGSAPMRTKPVAIPSSMWSDSNNSYPSSDTTSTSSDYDHLSDLDHLDLDSHLDYDTASEASLSSKPFSSTGSTTTTKTTSGKKGKKQPTPQQLELKNRLLELANKATAVADLDDDGSVYKFNKRTGKLEALDVDPNARLKLHEALEKLSAKKLSPKKFGKVFSDLDSESSKDDDDEVDSEEEEAARVQAEADEAQAQAEADEAAEAEQRAQDEVDQAIARAKSALRRNGKSKGLANAYASGQNVDVDGDGIPDEISVIGEEPEPSESVDSLADSEPQSWNLKSAAPRLGYQPFSFPTAIVRRDPDLVVKPLSVGESDDEEGGLDDDDLQSKSESAAPYDIIEPSSSQPASSEVVDDDDDDDDDETVYDEEIEAEPKPMKNSDRKDKVESWLADLWGKGANRYSENHQSEPVDDDLEDFESAATDDLPDRILDDDDDDDEIVVGENEAEVQDPAERAEIVDEIRRELDDRLNRISDLLYFRPEFMNQLLKIDDLNELTPVERVFKRMILCNSDESFCLADPLCPPTEEEEEEQAIAAAATTRDNLAPYPSSDEGYSESAPSTQFYTARSGFSSSPSSYSSPSFYSSARDDFSRGESPTDNDYLPIQLSSGRNSDTSSYTSFDHDSGIDEDELDDDDDDDDDELISKYPEEEEQSAIYSDSSEEITDSEEVDDPSEAMSQRSFVRNHDEDEDEDDNDSEFSFRYPKWPKFPAQGTFSHHSGSEEYGYTSSSGESPTSSSSRPSSSSSNGSTSSGGSSFSFTQTNGDPMKSQQFSFTNNNGGPGGAAAYAYASGKRSANATATAGATRKGGNAPAMANAAAKAKKGGTATANATATSRKGAPAMANAAAKARNGGTAKAFASTRRV